MMTTTLPETKPLLLSDIHSSPHLKKLLSNLNNLPIDRLPDTYFFARLDTLLIYRHKTFAETNGKSPRKDDYTWRIEFNNKRPSSASRFMREHAKDFVRVWPLKEEKKKGLVGRFVSKMMMKMKKKTMGSLSLLRFLGKRKSAASAEWGRYDDAETGSIEAFENALRAEHFMGDLGRGVRISLDTDDDGDDELLPPNSAQDDAIPFEFLDPSWYGLD